MLILGVDTGSGSQKKKEKSILAQSPNEKRWRDGQLSSVTQVKSMLIRIYEMGIPISLSGVRVPYLADVMQRKM